MPPSAVDKAVTFYKKCKETRANFTNYISDGSIIKSVIDNFKAASGLEFSMVLSQNAQGPQSLTPVILGKAIGLLSAQGVHTLLTPMVDTNWPTAKTFFLFVDQSTLYYAKTYYSPLAWPTIDATYKADTIDLFNQFAQLFNVSSFPSLKQLLEFFQLLLNQVIEAHPICGYLIRRYANAFFISTRHHARTCISTFLAFARCILRLYRPRCAPMYRPLKRKLRHLAAVMCICTPVQYTSIEGTMGLCHTTNFPLTRQNRTKSFCNLIGSL